MRLWLRRNHALAWVILAIVVLSLASLIKEGLLSPDWLKKNQDLIGTTSTVITTALVVLAALASYFRFFHGRLLNPKLRIGTAYGLIEIDDGNLHWLDVELENTGPIALWGYNVTIVASFDQDNHHVHLHSLASKEDSGDPAIDPGETAYEHGTIKVPKEADFITFRIEVRSPAGTTWDRCVTVSNRT